MHTERKGTHQVCKPFVVSYIHRGHTTGVLAMWIRCSVSVTLVAIACTKVLGLEGPGGVLWVVGKSRAAMRTCFSLPRLQRSSIMVRCSETQSD